MEVIVKVKAEAKAKVILMLKVEVEAMARVLVEEMQLGMAGVVIQRGIKKAVKEEAVIAERKDSGRP